MYYILNENSEVIAKQIDEPVTTQTVVTSDNDYDIALYNVIVGGIGDNGEMIFPQIKLKSNVELAMVIQDLSVQATESQMALCDLYELFIGGM